MINKKLLAVLAVCVFVLSYNISYANNENINDFDKNKSPKCQKNQYHHPHPRNINMDILRPSKEEMEQKKAEFEKRLNLTDEQKKQIEENRAKDTEKIKPIMEKIHIKRNELHKILNNQSLSQTEKDQKAQVIKNEIRKLKQQADKYHKENMRRFEEILTEEQKQEFEKIKEEQKQEMEQRRKKFIEMGRNNQ